MHEHRNRSAHQVQVTENRKMGDNDRKQEAMQILEIFLKVHVQCDLCQWHVNNEVK